MADDCSVYGLSWMLLEKRQSRPAVHDVSLARILPLLAFVTSDQSRCCTSRLDLSVQLRSDYRATAGAIVAVDY